MNEKTERKRIWKGGKKNIPFYIISTIVLFLFGIVFIGGYSKLWYVKDNVDFTQSVEATITDVYDHYDGQLHRVTYYFLRYEYTSPDGVYYWNTFEQFEDKEEAMSHIGEKIQIYIDGKGTSVPSDVYRHKPNTWVLILGIVFLVAGLAVFVVLVIPHKWR